MIDRAEAAAGAAPHGVTLFDHATIAAEIAEQREPIGKILARHGLSESAWNDSTAYWMQRILQDTVAHQERARTPIVYSQAFSDAQDALAPVKAMTPAAYAELVVEMQEAAGSARPLERRGLSSADFQRLVRHFARLLGANPDESKQFGDRFAELTRT
jgi:hypothetical protein